MSYSSWYSFKLSWSSKQEKVENEWIARTPMHTILSLFGDFNS